MTSLVLGISQFMTAVQQDRYRVLPKQQTAKEISLIAAGYSPPSIAERR